MVSISVLPEIPEEIALALIRLQQNEITNIPALSHHEDL